LILIPAVDVSMGECVRFIQGDPERRLIYSKNPVEVALQWQNKGAQYLHVVDLDSALGLGENRSSIKEILGEVSIPVQVGGGIRTMEEAEKMLDWGASRVILGTAIIADPEVVRETVRILGGVRVMAAIDQRGGKVAIKGWKEATTVDPYLLASKIERSGIGSILYSSIEQDGFMQGPNLKGIEGMVRTVKIPVIAAGGISKLSDVTAVGKAGAAGVIVGRALYDHAFTLEDALKEASSQR
jgi:phosphoribosylformimino-5-aminoimidazole carboxamide ribotide isomerase